MDKAEIYALDADDWESGKLGQTESSVERADAKLEASIEESLGLQMISIRLQKKLIEDLKFIGTAHGIGYQPLIRDILSRFVVHEVKTIMRETIERRKLEDETRQNELNATPARRAA